MQSLPARADVAQRVKQRSRTIPPLRGLILLRVAKATTQTAVIFCETSKPTKWVIDEPPILQITGRCFPDRDTIGGSRADRDYGMSRHVNAVTGYQRRALRLTVVLSKSNLRNVAVLVWNLCDIPFWSCALFDDGSTQSLVGAVPWFRLWCINDRVFSQCPYGHKNQEYSPQWVCPRTPGAVYKCLGCSPNCGRCIATMRTIINEALAEATVAGSSVGVGSK